MWTPNDIEILIHYHCVPKPHPRYETMAVKESTEKFLALGLIEETKSVATMEHTTYRTTQLGKALMEAILMTPVPETHYVDPRTDEVISKWKMTPLNDKVSDA